MADDFNFIIDEPDKTTPLVPQVVEDGQLSKLVQMTPRKFAQTVLDVFGELGGVIWLKEQAKGDPRGFIELLKKIMPSNIQAEGFGDITVRIVDQYGNVLEIDAQGGGQPVATGGDHSPRSGQPQIATSGNPITDVKIKETYE